MKNEHVDVLLGVDVQPVDEVAESLRTFGARYRRLLFTDHELESCGDDSDTPSSLAARFAAKEAVLKVLDTRELVPKWRSIEVRTAANERSKIVLYDEAARLARAQGVYDLSVSLSCVGTVAMAAVVAAGRLVRTIHSNE